MRLIDLREVSSIIMVTAWHRNGFAAVIIFNDTL